jgi:hypothetical protein
MPKNPIKKRINPDLTPEEYEPFHKEAVRRYWSDKRLCEYVIRSFLKLKNKDDFIDGMSLNEPKIDYNTNELKWLKEKVVLQEMIIVLQGEIEKLKTTKK